MQLTGALEGSFRDAAEKGLIRLGDWKCPEMCLDLSIRKARRSQEEGVWRTLGWIARLERQAEVQISRAGLQYWEFGELRSHQSF